MLIFYQPGNASAEPNHHSDLFSLTIFLSVPTPLDLLIQILMSFPVIAVMSLQSRIWHHTSQTSLKKCQFHRILIKLGLYWCENSFRKDLEFQQRYCNQNHCQQKHITFMADFYDFPLQASFTKSPLSYVCQFLTFEVLSHFLCQNTEQRKHFVATSSFNFSKELNFYHRTRYSKLLQPFYRTMLSFLYEKGSHCVKYFLIMQESDFYLMTSN